MFLFYFSVYTKYFYITTEIPFKFHRNFSRKKQKARTYRLFRYYPGFLLSILYNPYLSSAYKRTCALYSRIVRFFLRWSLFSVVAFQVDFFDLLEERVSRVCSCTLVIECLLYHVIQCVKEVFLIDTILFDGFLDSDLFF